MSDDYYETMRKEILRLHSVCREYQKELAQKDQEIADLKSQISDSKQDDPLSGVSKIYADFHEPNIAQNTGLRWEDAVQMGLVSEKT